MILSLAELKKDKELINNIDWEMTPEQAVGFIWNGVISMPAVIDA